MKKDFSATVTDDEIMDAMSVSEMGILVEQDRN